MLLKKTVDSILGGLAKMEQQLLSLSTEKANEVVEIADKISDLDVKADAARAERDRASSVARKLHELIN